MTCQGGRDKRMTVFLNNEFLFSMKSDWSFKDTRRSRIRSRAGQLRRNYPWSTSFFPITRTIMLMVALSFISIHKFVFLIARLWDIIPWSLVLQFALQYQFKFQFQFRVHIVSLRSFLEDFVFSANNLTDVPQYVTCMLKHIWSNSPQR